MTDEIFVKEFQIKDIEIGRNSIENNSQEKIIKDQKQLIQQLRQDVLKENMELQNLNKENERLHSKTREHLDYISLLKTEL